MAADPVTAPLPVLANRKTNQIATFDPSTGKPVVTARLEHYLVSIDEVVGSTVVLSYQPPSLSTSNGGPENYPYAWFDSYEPKGGRTVFDTPVVHVLGSDGTDLLMLYDDRARAYGPDSESPLWSTYLRDSSYLRVVGGRVYVDSRRLI